MNILKATIFATAVAVTSVPAMACMTIDRTTGGHVVHGANHHAIYAVRKARANVRFHQQRVRALSYRMRAERRFINQRYAMIRAKKRWALHQPWYKRAQAETIFAAYAAARKAEIGAAYTRLGDLKAAKKSAMASLRVAPPEAVPGN